MNLAVCHYHLQTGGVTRIIQSQVAALNGAGCVDHISVLAGSPPEGPAFAEGREVIIHPDLDYLPQDAGAEECRRRSRDLLAFLRGHMNRSDILHVHNPNLGKNPVLSHVLWRLSRKGFRLVFHCHDFAEDRPANAAFNRRILGYLDGDEGAGSPDPRDVLYPRSPLCLFGVLNSHDRRRLADMGVERNRIRLLPNPVVFSAELPEDASDARRRVCRRLDLPPDRPIFLYPVRVIRRKNIGELILLACLFRDRASWLVTRAPHNPAEQEPYERWKKLNADLGNPVVFEAGHRLDFPDLLRAADRVITTSIREGFGMSFLEPWLAGLPVVGRRIPEVVDDFVAAGMAFDRLYDRLPVPEHPGSPDFPALDQSEQISLIREACEDRTRARELARRWNLEALLFGDVPRDAVERNRQTVQSEYSLESYGRRLCRLYRRLGLHSDAAGA